VRPLFAATA